MSAIVLETHEADLERRRAAVTWWVVYLIVVGGGLMIAAFSRRRITEPFIGMTLGLFLLLLLGWLLRPRATLYATILLTAISDIETVWWFPFVKNFSSRESISFVADAVTVSPLDVTLGVGVVVSAVRQYARHGRLVAPTRMLWPVTVFTAFVAFGFVRGLAVGGDRRVAVLEGRPLFYVLLTFVIVVNECTEDAHFRRALWALLVGVLIQSLLSIEYLSRLAPSQRADIESLTEHGSAVGHALFLVTLIVLLLFRLRRPLLRWALTIGAIPVVYVFFVAQRRAGVATLVIAGALVALLLLWRRPRTFWFVTPLVLGALTVYLAAFWNSTSTAGFPAQAIKSIIAPGSLTEEDLSSNIYRRVEAFDLNFTIRTDPLRGIGFGRPFYRPIPLPDISVFELNAYQPHNSILWIWLKTGFFGFVAMLYMLAKPLMLGAERLRTARIDVDFLVTTAAVTYVAMFAVFSYVDVSWDARNTVFLGFAIATATRPGAPPTEEEPLDDVAVDRTPVPALTAPR